MTIRRIDMAGILQSASAERNKTVILDELQIILSDTRSVLEIASGSGTHAEFFARRLPWLDWIPSDIDAASLQSIELRRQQTGLTNLAPPIAFNVLEPWPAVSVEAIYVANLLHISSAETLPALCCGAFELLDHAGRLIIYGPFRRGGSFVSPTDAQFDLNLRTRNRDWGIRDLETVLETAESSGFGCTAVIEMPANNLLLSLEKP